MWVKLWIKIVDYWKFHITHNVLTSRKSQSNKEIKRQLNMAWTWRRHSELLVPSLPVRQHRLPKLCHVTSCSQTDWNILLTIWDHACLLHKPTKMVVEFRIFFLNFNFVNVDQHILQLKAFVSSPNNTLSTSTVQVPDENTDSSSGISKQRFTKLSNVLIEYIT